MIIKTANPVPFSQRNEFILPVEDCKFANGKIWLKFSHPITGEKLVYGFQEEWISKYKYYFCNSRLLFMGKEEISEDDLKGRLIKVHIENGKVSKISEVYDDEPLIELADELSEHLEKEYNITTIEELEHFIKYGKKPETKVENQQTLLF